MTVWLELALKKVKVDLRIYMDSDYARSLIDCRSTIGYLPYWATILLHREVKNLYSIKVKH